MVYSAADDPACYPNTDILRNKANIRQNDDLAQFELAMFLIRSEEDWPVGQFDYEHYLSLHRHLFQDVYEWVGSIRTIRIGKSGHWFCYPENIDQEMERGFSGLIGENWYQGLEKPDFVSKAAHFLAELNAIHPFREGNGRTQMAFLIILAENAGFQFDDSKLDPETVLEAMIFSFKGNETPLVDLLNELIA